MAGEAEARNPGGTSLDGRVVTQNADQWRLIVTHREHGRVPIFEGYSESTIVMGHDAHVPLGTEPVIQRRRVRIVTEYGEWEDVPREEIP